MAQRPEAAGKLGAAQPGAVLPARGRLRALVIFARFADEVAAPVPEWAGEIFARERPGSLSHFYHTMSFGALEIQGEVLPIRYSSAQLASAYLAPGPAQEGAYGAFVRQILSQVDGEVDFALFDNDGPDGVPGSGDDDGWVDYVFVNVLSAPEGFLRHRATGIAGLGLGDQPWATQDQGADGRPIRISGAPARGAIQEEGNFAQTVGAMAHEFGHALGLPDLYDLKYDSPAEDSAGIGRWGLMGWGARGWGGDDGPVPFCAWSLERLGWIGPDNGRLVEIAQDALDLRLRDLFAGGTVYRVPLRAETPDNSTLNVEYLLLEYRSQAQYYSRGQPGSGLLVWHVRPQVNDNDQEERKQVDLVCADGLYQDAGYPLGQVVDGHRGRDNLDFWARQVDYSRAHGGNLGDATDLFDGVRFARLDLETNPSTLPSPTLGEASTGLALRHMRPEAEGLRLDVVMPRWAGTIREEVHWSGQVLVEGDLTVAPEGRLVIFRNVQVRVAGTDRLRGGLDPEKTEIHVQGDLIIREVSRSQVFNVPRLASPDSTRFAALEPGQTWAGLFISPRPASTLVLPQGSYQVQDAEQGLVVEGPPPRGESLRVRGFAFNSGIAADGAVRLEPGEAIRMILEVENLSALSFFTGARAYISWEDPALAPAEGRRWTRTVSFPPGRKQLFFIGRAPVLRAEAQAGQRLRFTLRIEKNEQLIWEDVFSAVVGGEATVVGAKEALPAALALLPNYPNPFNGRTEIAYNLAEEGPVQLRVLNLAGQVVKVLVSQVQGAGAYQVGWDGTRATGEQAGSGVYLYRLEAGGRVQTRKLVLLR